MRFDKRMNRVFVFLILGIYFLSLMGGVVAPDADLPAGPVDPEAAAEGVKALWQGGADFIGALFGDTVLGSDNLTRIFMAILIAMFVYTALGSFFGDDTHWAIHWGATIAASALAMIGLPVGFLESIRTGYGAMGGAILSVIPFLVIFWFSMKTKSLLMARITWLFYTVYYFALMISAWYESGLWSGWYMIAILIGVVIFFFILKIRGFIWEGELETIKEKGAKKATMRQTLLAAEMERLHADD